MTATNVRVCVERPEWEGHEPTRAEHGARAGRYSA